jgi:mannose-6-phosphate isomerase-like protein (cupin superfamily)
MHVKEAKSFMSPEFEERPWGNYTVLDSGDGFKVKRIEVLPGKRLSYQKHAHRAEHWQIVQGIAKVTLNGRETLAGKGEIVDIPVGTKHRVQNQEKKLLIFIEIQLGDYLGEDDIERFEDDFGRV